MTIKRLQLKTPEIDFSFQIHNGTIQKDFTRWQFCLDWDQVKQFKGLGGHPYLADILREFGSYSTLWIDQLKGTIAPMDIEPTGWLYPSGQPLEPEWFWRWYPDEKSQATLMGEYNNNYSNPLFGKTNILKSLVPYQQGQVQAIEAIPVSKLAGIVKGSCLWTFEANS